MTVSVFSVIFFVFLFFYCFFSVVFFKKKFYLLFAGNFARFFLEFSMKFYSIYDRKAGAFNVPQPFRHDADAVRAVQQLVNGGDSLFSTHCADFDLFYVGEFVLSSGWFAQGNGDDDVKPLFLVSLASLKEISNAKA